MSFQYLREILAIEIPYAWTAAGLLTVVAALALGPWLAAFGYGLLWYAGVLVYYVVIAGTSTGNWARYYHVVSIPPIALLFGASAAVVWLRAGALGPVARRLAVVAGAGVAATGALAERVLGGTGRMLVGMGVLLVAGAAGLARVVGARSRAWPAWAGVGVVGCVGCLTLLSAARQTARESH